MLLLDHFHPPVKEKLHWVSLHAGWTTRIADAINELLPAEFIAAEHAYAGGSLEIDVATMEQAGKARNGPTPSVPGSAPGGQIALATPGVWVPPVPAGTIPGLFPDTFEVLVFQTTGGLTLVGAIELISPGNKDRPDERRAFAAKCASFLHQGISLIIVDIVTTRRANLHNETMRLLEAPAETDLPPDTDLYSAAYRPVRRDQRPEIDFWTATFSLGGSLPTMPLRLTGDLFVPVDFEATYQEACRKRRLA